MADVLNKYQQGKVYKLVVGDQIYVGSTTKTLAARKQSHIGISRTDEKMRRLYDAVEAVGWDNVTMELLELAPCNTKEELLWRERHYYDALQPTLNDRRPIISTEESKAMKLECGRAWNAKHLSTYRQANQVKLTEYQKTYREANQVRLAECKAAQYEANKEALRAKQKAYYEANKELIAAKDKAKRAAKKATIVAE